MCGIIGYYSNTPTKEHGVILKSLINQSKIRGLHAFGYSYLEGDKYLTKKYYQNEFNQIEFPITKQLIFHNRYSTSGDFKNHINNQPINIEEVGLVFNGVINMGTKEEMEQEYNITLTTSNDGEVLLRVSDFNPEDMLKFITENKCSFSGLLLKDKTLYALRNKNRPGWFLEYNGGLFIASTKDIFVRALGNVEPKELEPNILHSWTI